MRKVLYINGNPKKEESSLSRQTAKYYLKQLQKNIGESEVEVLNVYEEDIPLINGDVLDAWDALEKGVAFNKLTIKQQELISRMNQILEQFLSADEYVFATPLWNFSIPPKLKAYIDNIVIVNKTFKYTDKGPVGLVNGKKATIIQASGGIYSSGPSESLEHGSKYIETVLRFIGVKEVKRILVEGVDTSNKSMEEKLKNTFNHIDSIFA